MVGLDDEYAGERWARGPGPLVAAVVGLVLLLVLMWFTERTESPPPEVTPVEVIE